MEKRRTQNLSNDLDILRVNIPNGILNSAQARTLAGIAQDYGRKQINITARQTVQVHRLRAEKFPDIFKPLNQAGLRSIKTCHNRSRTVVSNILAGIDPHELFDTRPIVQQVRDYLQLNDDNPNLPRKFKISISSSAVNSCNAEINDLAFIPAYKEEKGEPVQGFHVLVGGGLATKPLLAQQLDLFVRPEQVLPVVKAVAAIYRDHGCRKNGRQARLKYLVADWGAERFLAELLKLTGPLPGKAIGIPRSWNGGYFYGVHRQRQGGLNYVGLNLPLGELTAEDLQQLARLANQYGDGSLRICNSQNIILANIPDAKVNDLLAEKLLERLSPAPRPLMGYVFACRGKEYCRRGLVETKARLKSIVRYLDQRFELDSPIRIYMSGCPNSCGQQQIADIGLQGALRKVDSQMIESFQLFLGGTLGPKPRFGTKLKGHIPAEQLAKTIEHLLEYYVKNRHAGETFHHFVNRVALPVNLTEEE